MIILLILAIIIGLFFYIFNKKENYSLNKNENTFRELILLSYASEGKLRLSEAPRDLIDNLYPTVPSYIIDAELIDNPYIIYNHKLTRRFSKP